MHLKITSQVWWESQRLWERNLFKNPTFTSRWSLAPVLGGSLHLETVLWSNCPCTHFSSGVLFWINFAPDYKLLRARAFLWHTMTSLPPRRTMTFCLQTLGKSTSKSYVCARIRLRLRPGLHLFSWHVDPLYSIWGVHRHLLCLEVNFKSLLAV